MRLLSTKLKLVYCSTTLSDHSTVAQTASLRHDLFMSFMFVGLGGFLGAILRYSVSLLFSSSGFPWATLCVNVFGCLTIAYFSFSKNPLPPNILLFLIPGFLGAFTTFSAFGLETMRLFQAEQWALAIVNILLNLLLGLGSVAIVYRFFLN